MLADSRRRSAIFRNLVAVYLDHHASHPMLPAVQNALRDALVRIGNPSSVHRYGQQLRGAIEDVREALARWVGLPEARVIFTSGATEANNLILAGHRGTTFGSTIEHPAVLARIPPEQQIAVGSNGLLDLATLEARLETLSPDAHPLISIMLANNETGVIQPIAKIARCVHHHRGLLHVDGVQGLGRMELDMRVLGIDALSVAGHKIGAPPGIGALILPEALPLEAQIYGGGQERGLRAGTENWLGILGLGAAIDWFGEHQNDYVAHLAALDRHLVQKLAASPAQIVAEDSPRLPGCALLVAPDAEAQNLLMHLDLAGVAVSSGAACSSGTVADSHVLRAMNLDSALRRSAIRVSFGLETQIADLERFLEVYLEALA